MLMESFFIVLVLITIVLLVKLWTKIQQIDSKIDGLSKDIRNNIVAQNQRIKEPGQPQDIVQPQRTAMEVKPLPLFKVEEKKPEVLPVRNPTLYRPPIRKVEEKPKSAPKPSFMERNPDLEKFIGENLLSKIGIVIFVIGMGFLVKLGIDSNVITEGMRVAIGVLIGGAMVGLAHYMRKTFSNFSSILVGGALSVLYFTIALAFHDYQLIPQAAAFVIMIFITVFGVILSIAYDRKELAILAMLGGFGTPFFISTGSGNFSVLLTYVLILDIGMLSLVYFKKWNIINYLAYGFTYLLFFGVFTTKFVGNEDVTRLPLFLFLTAYYLIFFLMNIIYNVKNDKKFKFGEIAMLISNSSIYFGLGLALMHGFKGGLYSGIFVALIALFNFGFTFNLYKRKGIDKNLLFLLIGLVLTFVSLIAPIQLKGNYITLFWAVEAVFLLWLYKKSTIELMKVASFIVSVLMLISLVIDWSNLYDGYYGDPIMAVFLNKAFMTSLTAIASLVGLNYFMNETEVVTIKGIELVWKKLYVKTALIILVYLGFLLELNYQFIQHDFLNTFIVILLGIYNFAFVLGLIALARFKQSELLKNVTIVLSGLAIVSYVLIYQYHITVARTTYLLGSESDSGYFYHYGLFVLFVLLLVHICRWIHQKFTFKSQQGTVSLWIIAGIVLCVGSLEAGHLSMIYQQPTYAASNAAYAVAVKSVYPIVWAITALILMVVGMKFRLKPLRLSSLVLFSITILKLFFYDLQGNSTGKIVSFILLGVILLVISFLYQKLKFIIQNDDEK